MSMRTMESLPVQIFYVFIAILLNSNSSLATKITYSSCIDVHNKVTGATDATYILQTNEGETFTAYCEFTPTRIYTYIAPTILKSLNTDDLYSNKHEVVIRHKLTSGVQREAIVGQITKYESRSISIQYNESTGYAQIRNTQMSPYLYMGFLPKKGIDHRGDKQGYSVNGRDYTFINCDGNPNSYFALLYNGADAAYNPYAVVNPFMKKWFEDAIPVVPDRYIPDKFFCLFEMHMGGCGGYITSEHLSDLVGVTIGLIYVIEKCNDPNLNNCDPIGGQCVNIQQGYYCTCKKGYGGDGNTCKEITYSSCIDVYNKVTGATDDTYILRTNEGETFTAYCEFTPTRIYTYIAPTNLISLNTDDLYSNKDEIVIRHKLTNGVQRESIVGQITKYESRSISIQYNESTGYAKIRNTQMSPYLYMGFLPKKGIYHRGDKQGYSVNGRDYTFINCDGNPNSYFALLYNGADAAYNPYAVVNPFMKKWFEDAIPVVPDRYIPDKFFCLFEMHMGGCGGYITSKHLSNLVGVTIGLIYDIDVCTNPELNNCDPVRGQCHQTENGFDCTCKDGFIGDGTICTEITYTSCMDLFDKTSATKDGVYALRNNEGNTFKVYCEFFSSHIYTYIAPTILLPNSVNTINIDELTNNKQEVVIRHKLMNGNQFQANIGQITEYKSINISIQFNTNIGYAGIQNPQMDPYLYLGFLPLDGISHKNDKQGYSVNGRDYKFTNCDGNPNSYLALLYNENQVSFGSKKAVNLAFMKKWMDDAEPVDSDHYLPDNYFAQCEMHLGGCGGYLTSQNIRNLAGVSFGLRYDINECIDPDLNDCDPVGGECLNTVQGYECSCRDGYTGNGITCSDINECSDEDLNNCDPEGGACQNTVPGFTCSCKDGYTGDGISCSVLDICVSSCKEVKDGDYQSCKGCNVYVSCVGEILYDNRPCPAGLVWDDNKKLCDWESDTCSEDSGSNEEVSEVCEEKDCSSWNYAYAECSTPGKSYDRVSIVKKFSRSACTLDKSYGLNNNGLWVDQGCRGKFKLCECSSFDVMECRSIHDQYTTCNWESTNIVTKVKVMTQISEINCEFDISFGIAKNRIWVDKGCQAVFKVCTSECSSIKRVLCDSWGYRYVKCSLDTVGEVRSVELVHQRSRSDCVPGTSFGVNEDGLWVDKGCRATFSVCFE